ncbi:MAG: UMP kinase [bacterium]
MNNPLTRERAIYKRVLLKISGEALMGAQDYGIDADTLKAMSDEGASAAKSGVQIAMVIGGGNIFRGLSAAKLGVERVTGDQMGMLGTVINALAFRDALEKAGIPARLQTASAMPQVAEPFVLPKAVRHLEKGRVVLFAGGTGNPLFTTDTAASLRAGQLKADILLKGTKVDGVYDDDPCKNANAKKFRQISYLDVVDQRLGVMDATAVTFCMDHRIPIRVFNFRERGNLPRILQGEEIGTLISS